MNNYSAASKARTMSWWPLDTWTVYRTTGSTQHFVFYDKWINELVSKRFPWHSPLGVLLSACCGTAWLSFPVCSWSSVSCDELDRGLQHKGACTISWWSVHLNNNRGRIVSVQEAHCCYGGEERGAWDLEYFLLWSGMQGRHCVSFFWSVTAHEVMTVKLIHVFSATM